MFKDFVARALMGLVPVIYMTGGLWMLMAEFGWLESKIGAWAWLAMLLAPITFVVTPFAAGLLDGQWNYLWLSLGTLVLSWLTTLLAGVAVAWAGTGTTGARS